MIPPVRRPRRLRSTPAIRRLVAETRVHPAQLLLPVFVADGIEEPRPIGSLPGVVQHTLDSVRTEAVRAVEAGLGGLVLFGVTAREEIETFPYRPSLVLESVADLVPML